MRTRPAIVFACIAIGAIALAQEGDDIAPARFAPRFELEGLDMRAGMRAQMASMQPSERHELLEYFLGGWATETVITSPMGDGKMTSRGKASFEMILDGRFLRGAAAGTMPGMGRTESVTLIGYDTHASRYDITMLNTMSTATLRAEGLSNEAGDAIIFYGPMDEPAIGLRERTVRYTWRLVDGDTFRVEIDDLAIGDAAKERVVTTTYRRQ